jgi:uncharacterized membrane protein HdeD (DUF308 family)
VQKDKDKEHLVVLNQKNIACNWIWLFCLGFLLVVMGCLGVQMAIGLTLASMYFFAGLLIISSISHIIDSVTRRGWQGVFWQVTIAVLYLLGAIAIASDPFLASALITVLLASAIFIIGLTRIMLILSVKNTHGWGWLLFAGIAAIILSLLILMQWPISGLWVIGIFIAIEMIINGFTFMFVAVSIRASSS